MALEMIKVSCVSPITTIHIHFDNMQTSEILQFIDYEDVKIMIEQGQNTSFVLILKEESSFLKYKLRAFSEEFHKFFETILLNWKGDIEVFNPTETLIQEIFELKP